MRFNTSLSNPVRQEKLFAALKIVADSGQYSEGIHVYKLQKTFQKLLQGQFGTAFNCIGSALFATFRYYYSLGHRAIALQNNSHYAVGRMALEAGLRVHLIDSSPSTPSMGIDSLNTALQSRKDIKLVLLSHIGGFIAENYPEIFALCDEKGVTMLEDCSPSIGIRGTWATPGYFGEASCWSFNSAKGLPAGEGALLMTKSPELRNYVRKFVNYGKHHDGVQERHGEGFNLKMSEWDATVACVQMESMDEILEARQRDVAALRNIAPCLLDGQQNFSRYPIDASLIKKMSLAPSIFASHEQLGQSLGKHPNVTMGNLANSFRWAQNHRCLPLGEGVYDGMTTKEIEKRLSGKLQ